MAHDAHADSVGHVVPLWLLVGVLAALLALTVLTVAITWYDLGWLNLAAALAIATVKATLVLLYFMHLRWDRPFNAIVLVLSLVLVMLFVFGTLYDKANYEPEVIPGYSPGVPSPAGAAAAAPQSSPGAGH
jgi:cytochrome c oxidase subunit 4